MLDFYGTSVTIPITLTVDVVPVDVSKVCLVTLNLVAAADIFSLLYYCSNSYLMKSAKLLLKEIPTNLRSNFLASKV